MEESQPGFWGNLNAFVPAWVLMTVTLGWLVTFVFMAPLLLVSFITGPVGNAPWATAFTTWLPIIGGPLVFGLFLARRWAKHGLIPGPILRLTRYKLGQALLVAFNLLVPGGFLALTVYQKFIFSGPPDTAGVLGFMLVPAFGVAIPCAVAGFALVWTSRTATTPIPTTERKPNREVIKALGNPIGVLAYCEKYSVERTQVDVWLSDARLRGYVDKGALFVEDSPPRSPGSSGPA